MTELKDEELNKVSGGGGGNLPPEGITFSKYSRVWPNYYYSKDMSLNNVVYVFVGQSGCKSYTHELFTVDEIKGKWKANRISPEIKLKLDKDFTYEFPYTLNVRA